MKTIRTLAMLCLAGLTSLALAAAPGEVDVGQTLPDAAMLGLSGPSRTLSAYRGRPLVINVWASWCGPCRSEMASLERLSRRWGGRRFAVIGISTDDYRDKALGFLRQAGTTFDHYIDERLKLEQLLGASRIPLTVLVDAQGRVVSKHYGAMDWDGPEALAIVRQAFRIPM